MSQISIVKLSKVKKDERFDAEFYKQSYLETDRKIETLIFDKLINLSKKIDVGFFGTMKNQY